mmetsp:Transcript_12222/g.33623  ORF Transcript_12222/g.33623 Transcript_12222/m.33623 type:complete len:114 (-) Transcript_12222:5-346(-)
MPYDYSIYNVYCGWAVAMASNANMSNRTMVNIIICRLEHSCSLEGSGFEKKYTDAMISVAPTKKPPVSFIPMNSMLNAVANSTLNPVASPFMTLSAYLITDATTSPPTASHTT